MENETKLVRPERLRHGGDIDASYSADKLAYDKKSGVRAPFSYAGELWIAVCLTGTGRAEWQADAYRLLTEERFFEETIRHALEETIGYHGRHVQWRGKAYRLCGPRTTFIAGDEPPEPPAVVHERQLTLWA